MPPGLEKDLRRLVKGDVLCDDLSRTLYSTAACIFQMMPRGVVVPRDREDVIAVVKYAAEQGIPVTARGAGSGLAGQTLGEGIILDLSKYMNAILELNQVQSWVRVQPGVVLGKLNRYLKQFGLWFPPDPSSGDVATLGGMIANNAAGAHTVKYGPTREYVLGLECVMDDGSLNGGPRWKGLEAEMKALLDSNRALIEQSRPNVLKNSSGYHVFDPQFDMNRLLVGSEGTLAIVTEAKLKVVRRPAEKALMRIYFDDLETMGRAVVALRPLNPAALEVIYKTMIDLVKNSVMEWRQKLPATLRAILLCEFDGEKKEWVGALVEKARGLLGEALDITVASGHELESLWKVRKAASPILERMQGPLRSTRIIEDACVHPDNLVAYIQGLKKIFTTHGVEGIVFGHAGSGHVHVNVLMEPHGKDHNAKILPICNDVATLVAGLKGTLSGEHGDGILRAAWVRKIFGALVPVFEQVKKAFDPKNILNPGKKIQPADFDFTKYLRASRRHDYEYRPDSPFAAWTKEIERCHGCGFCRTYCPVYQERPDEAATPRGKAALLQGALEGRFEIDSKSIREVADLCINCKLCLVQCPSGVDIPGMCLEAKAFDVSKRGLSKRDEMFVKVRENSERAVRWAPLSNWLMPLIGAFKGIRRSPEFVADGTRTTRKSDKKVIYFAGCFADYNDPKGEKQATIDVLERNGYEVVIPEYQCCGLAATSLGARDEAAACARHNVDLLSGSDLPIVTSAPSCGLQMKLEVPQLVPGEAAKKVAARVVDVHDFLLGLHQKGELDVNFKRIASTLILHPTCHLRALGADKAARKVLQLIPSLELVEIPERCCGMAGSFGMKSETYDLSQAIGKHVFSDIKKANPTLLAASNGTCRMHIGEGTQREVLHTMTLLQQAYGLSPLEGFHKVHEGVALQSFKDHMDRSTSGDE
ncbi:MAG: FAD-binding protein [Planctomycetes bacterium]|nr:FAD-binding protein [Planctomycetota bacterium]